MSSCFSNNDLNVLIWIILIKGENCYTFGKTRVNLIGNLKKTYIQSKPKDTPIYHRTYYAAIYPVPTGT